MSADPTSTVPDLELGDEPYDSAEDEDFQLDGAEDDSDQSGPSDAEDAAEPVKKKRKTGKDKGQDEQELDSGDEATIKKAKAKKDKKGKKSKNRAGDDSEDDEDDVDFDDDEEGGPGGFVRTRAMKMHMREEKKPLAKVDGATVDVDALWAKMNAPDTGSGLEKEQQDTTPAVEDTEKPSKKGPPAQDNKNPTKASGETIKIKRTYKFAGEMITEEKVVPKDSAEAKLFLANGKNEAVTDADIENAANAKAALKLRRPLRTVSRFDPNPSGLIKKSWEKQPAAEPGAETAKGPKINTVEKSRLDWAAYVDQAGIKDELTVHSKAKEGYLGRMDFLDRVGANREEERRNARLKGM
ncbi:hypothetical protein ASPWEDRAFT_171620 [Aspergillus wentii DTO 134E9]|uniref:SWR1-complex protein 5 n=1 Tax=Aspergillus wentii DTO 134E9 TaxID=1073089 RepID=A0A1L9RIW4_ASPWE|nr:uncharacterized protein ASPWEDRAFT_171620 [Aspergillus wentii DTO 134E9]KAI9932254.1 swr complex subunit [Aspergillus wentii]OJJ34787.1 hypothetical protein ASPWEDRAFT_171620 [Aspergillus wentii DTO 134E9]